MMMKICMKLKSEKKYVLVTVKRPALLIMAM